MATHAPITGAPTRAPFILAPPAAISRVLATFNREQLAGFITVAIDLLDFAEPDADLELHGDELDGSPAEDEFMHHGSNGFEGPGCPLADPGEDDDPAGGNVEDEGEADDAPRLAAPIYDLDQSLGPVNEVEADRAHARILLQRSEVPSRGRY